MKRRRPLIAAVLFATAGGCIFLVLLNRVLLAVRDHPFKSVAIVIIATCLTAGIGTAVAPVRIYCKPDLFVVDVVSGT